jgi:hypothetical protein
MVCQPVQKHGGWSSGEDDGDRLTGMKRGRVDSFTMKRSRRVGLLQSLVLRSAR